MIPGDFYTIDSLFSTLLAGATGVLIVTGAVGHLLGSRVKREFKRWMAMILSITFAMIAAALGQEQSPLIWVVAAINGCLIYLTAVGANTLIAHAFNGENNGRKAENTPVRETSAARKGLRGSFTEPWW